MALARHNVEEITKIEGAHRSHDLSRMRVHAEGHLCEGARAAAVRGAAHHRVRRRRIWQRSVSGRGRRSSAFHDPCYLCRYLGESEAPRKMLARLSVGEARRARAAGAKRPVLRRGLVGEPRPPHAHGGQRASHGGAPVRGRIRSSPRARNARSSTGSESRLLVEAVAGGRERSHHPRGVEARGITESKRMARANRRNETGSAGRVPRAEPPDSSRRASARRFPSPSTAAR